MKHYDFVGETHRYHYPQLSALHIETCYCHCKRGMGKEMIFKANKCAVFTASLKQSQRHMFLLVKKQAGLNWSCYNVFIFCQVNTVTVVDFE